MFARFRRIWLRAIVFACLLAFLFAFSTAAPADDAVILRDGFTIRGKHFKEKFPQSDGLSAPLVFSRLAAFDGVDQGPRYVFFSSHTIKQLAAIEKDLPATTTLQFEMKAPMNPSPFRLPLLGSMKFGEFDEKWRRVIDVTLPDGKYEQIRQQITFINPTRLYIMSTSHVWRQAYATREFDPTAIRKFLASHPSLKEESGKIDPRKRMIIAEFMLEVGWLTVARDELARLKKLSPGEWDKELTEKYDQLQRAIDSAETRAVIEELELAVAAGRYQTAERYLAKYTPKAADAKDLTKLGDLKAVIETVNPRYKLACRQLRELIDKETGAARAAALGAATGAAIATSLPPPVPAKDMATLLTAAEAVYAEVHPDTVSRIEFFIDQAVQAENDRLKGRAPSKTPAQLLSLAITGWLQGKSAGHDDVKTAISAWNSRQMAIAYMREEGQNRRVQMMKQYLASNDKLDTEVLSQVVSFLPPITPADLTTLKASAIDPKLTAGVRDIYRLTTGLAPEEGGGLKYSLRLPPEYHHGRAYPVILVLNSPGFEAEKMVAGLSVDADRHGYIVAAVDWDRGGKPYDYSGRDHRVVHALLRELSRKFSIDTDKVFLFGYGEGANFALDMGISHPDLFAGVIAMCPNIVWQFYQEYWRNAQKLPVYTVIGEISGGGYDSLRKLYEKWLPLGFPALLTLYKGRSSEWYANEIPTMFDWMGRKTRVRGTASLRLNATRFEAWQSMRESDRRFYWIEFNELSPANTMRGDRPHLTPFPAAIRADIRKGNEIVLEDLRGVRKLTVWLERDMLDWSKDVSVKVPYARNPWKTKKLTPDPSVMFEHLYQTGDRKMLFYGKLEFDIASN